MSLLSFIYFFAQELYLFQLSSTHSTDKFHHMLLAHACSPHSLYEMRAILTDWLAHPLYVPCSLMLLEIIIQGDFLMIPFLISTCIFLIYDATDKTWVDAHLVDFKLGAQYQNLV